MSLRRASAEVSAWAGRAPVGFRPTEETFDAATVDAWHREGGRYLVALNHARSASPEIHPVAGDEGGMVLLPRLVKDDYNVFVQDGALRSERLVEAYARGMGKLHALGGLAVVSAHTQILDSDNRRRALLSAVDTARAQGGWWLAEGHDVARWWRARSRATVTAAPDLGFRVEASEEGLAGGWLELVLPDQDQAIPLVDGIPVPHQATPWGLRLSLGEIEPGGTREIRLVDPRDPEASSVWPASPVGSPPAGG